MCFVRTIVFLPQVTGFVLIGILVGWILKGKEVKALLAGIALSATVILFFDLPTYPYLVERGGVQFSLSNIPGDSELLLFAVLTFLITSMVSWIAAKWIPLVKKDYLLALAILIVIIMNFFAVVQTASNPPHSYLAKLESSIPLSEKTQFDGPLYLKVFFLMKQGLSYYDALPKACEEDIRMGHAPTSVFSWRLPTAYEIWQIFPANGTYVQFLFVVMSALSLIAAFFFASRYLKPVAALSAPIIIMPYLVYGATSFWFLFLEFWGLFLAIISMSLYVNRSRIKHGELIAAGASAFSAGLREHFIYLMIIPFVVAVRSRDRRRVATWLGAIGLFCSLYLYHYIRVKTYIGQAGGSPNFGAWLYGGYSYLKSMLSFGIFESYAWPKSGVVPLMILVLAVFGALLVKERDEKLYLLGLILTPALVSLVIGAKEWGDYWGIMYMPILLISAPLILQLMPSLCQERDSS